MEVFLSAGYQEHDLVTLNHCQMYLKGIYLSDICNGMGKTIEYQFWTGEKPADHHQYQWPEIPKPANKHEGTMATKSASKLKLGTTAKFTCPAGNMVR